MVEQVTPAGLTVVHRSLGGPIIPNDNDPAANPPATVGPPTARPGDPNGLELVDEGVGTPWPRSVLRPSAWSGWPAEWDTPNWGGHLHQLTDTAWAALDKNASIFSSMPPYLVNAAPSLSADWLTNPDPDLYGSWNEFAKQLLWDYQACGEAFVLTTARYSTGWPARFHVVPPWAVEPEIVDGRRRCSIGSYDVTDDIIHIRYQSTTGDAHGHGPLEIGRARLVASSLLTRYASNMAGAGGIPNAVLKHPEELTASQASALQSQWVESRMSSMGIPAVLSGGLTFETLQFSPKDMALVELAQLNEARICVLLGVPPTLLALPSGEGSLTYNNAQSIYDYHWRASLKPMADLLMSELSGRLLPRGTSIEVNRDAYVQPGPYERAQTWQILITLGVLTAEQVQQIERFTGITTDLSEATL